MVLLAPRLANGADHNRPFGFIRAKVRGHHFEFGRHIGVGVHGLAAIAPGVNDMSAVRSDVEGGGTGSVRREIPNRTRAGALIRRSIRALVDHATCKSHAGHNLDEFRGILADNGYVLQNAFID